MVYFLKLKRVEHNYLPFLITLQLILAPPNIQVEDLYLKWIVQKMNAVILFHWDDSRLITMKLTFDYCKWTLWEWTHLLLQKMPIFLHDLFMLFKNLWLYSTILVNSRSIPMITMWCLSYPHCNTPWIMTHFWPNCTILRMVF